MTNEEYKIEELFPRILQKAVMNGYEWDLINMQEFIYQKEYFSHEFLRAFFGEDLIDLPGYVIETRMFSWAYHGCQMLLSEDPVQYLKAFI